jgi:hypothetical protein
LLALALVQGCLMVQRYRDHAVPDAPTSPGENARVWPFARVPADQLDQPQKRTRHLFADWDWAATLGHAGLELLRRAVDLLADDRWFRALGTGLFIDRPFGHGKASLEPDQTLLLCHEAFSLTLANAQVIRWRQLLEELGQQLSQEELRLLRPRRPEEMPVRGLPIAGIAAAERPVPSLADAARVAADFIVLRTLPGSLRAFRVCFEEALKGSIDAADLAKTVLVARVKKGQGSILALFDSDFRPQLEFEVDAAAGLVHRAGIERPRRLQTRGPF